MILYPDELLENADWLRHLPTVEPDGTRRGTVPVMKFNPNHEPAGSEHGGEFADAPSGAGPASSGREHIGAHYVGGLMAIKPTKDELAWAPRYGTARPGECYQQAGQFLISDPLSSSGPTLPEGTRLVQGRLDKAGIDHAWVELPGGIVFDGAAQRYFDAKEYAEALGARAERTYDATEARIQAVTYRHWGPWYGPNAGKPKPPRRRKSADPNPWVASEPQVPIAESILAALEKAVKFNPNHEPAGSPEGGQFASGDGWNGSTQVTSKWDERLYNSDGTLTKAGRESDQRLRDTYGTTLGDVVRGYTPELPDGYAVGALTIDPYPPSKDSRIGTYGRIVVNGTIMREGKVVGKFERMIWPKGFKSPEVMRDALVDRFSFEMDPKHLGAGVARPLAISEDALYRKMGIQEVRLTAQSTASDKITGHQVWPLQGYTWDDDGAAHKVREAFWRVIAKRYGETSPEAKSALKLVHATAPAWDFARFRDSHGKTVGFDLMHLVTLRDESGYASVGNPSAFAPDERKYKGAMNMMHRFDDPAAEAVWKAYAASPHHAHALKQLGLELLDGWTREEIDALISAIDRALADGQATKFNPNHVPAGSSSGGQFAEGPGVALDDAPGGPNAFYHGTAETVAQNILREGLKAEHAGDVWHGMARQGSVYIGTDLDTAKSWALSATDKYDHGYPPTVRPVIFQVRIPDKARASLIGDRNFGPDSQEASDDYYARNLEFRGDIPPEWIEHAWIGDKPKEDIAGNPAPPDLWHRIKAAAEDGQVIYVVILVDETPPEEAAKAVKYNPNHEPAGSPAGGQFASGDGGNADPDEIGRQWLATEVAEAPRQPAISASDRDMLRSSKSALNSRLWSGKPLNAEEKEQAEALDRVTAMPLGQSMTVFRGLDVNWNWANQNLVAGNTFMHKGFVSTTRDPMVAAHFTDRRNIPGNLRVLLRLSGVTHGLNLEPYEAFAEKEILLPRGAQMRIDAVRGRAQLTWHDLIGQERDSHPLLVDATIVYPSRKKVSRP